ncbi:uncharacterized protein L203_103745 [Cryptococcus depauperatus CBS 7841]|uniref:Uncharacterized protein n=1 Tax=Cryptococcus depauperatus CBS 7841 TaxID=1295531 RepID=A0AAJ8JUI1_9TREE
MLASPRPISSGSMADPATPPPSLAKSYPRSTLLSLATCMETPPDRLRSFPVILRSSFSDQEWGIDEEHAAVLDGKPASEALPIPKPGAAKAQPTMGRPIVERKFSGSESDSSEVLFQFNSFSSAEKPAPIMLDFKNPFASSLGSLPIRLGARKNSAISFFQDFPASVNSSSSSVHLVPEGGGASHSVTLGKDFARMRLGRRNSSESMDSTGSGSSISIGNGGLNPFAAPFPLPPTTKPYTPPNSLAAPIHKLGSKPISFSSSTPAPSLKNTNNVGATTLPPPRNSSLPQKPSGLPPVFIKRESAALPQPMALPDVAPLGKDWVGEKALSGNDRRRMSAVTTTGIGMSSKGADAPGLSQVSFSSVSLPANRVGLYGRSGSLLRSRASVDNSSEGELLSSSPKRPERLAKLGERLRESVSHRKVKA